jgi:hypothetical protein
LLFDVAQRVHDAWGLVAGLGSAFQ